jgi:hypothetical protein
MDITTGQRTFYLAASGSIKAGTFDVPFVDTSGKNITCNYFSIMATTPTNGNLLSIAAEASGVAKTGNMILNSLSSMSVYTSINTSGICGLGVVASHGSVGNAVWHGANGELCNGLKIQVLNHVNNPEWTIGITYGNLLPYNPIRAMNSSLGQEQLAGSYNKGI